MDENNKSKVYVPVVSVKHTGGSGENAKPTSVVITKDHIKGPVKARITIEFKGGRFSTAGNFMVACNNFDRKGNSFDSL